MFGPGRRVARRTARRTTRRQMAIQGSMNQPEPEPQYAAPPPAPAAAAPDYAAELEQLAKLKAQGILSEEEFEAKKKQILGI
jgi:predicted Zn-dependent peptidase